MRRLLAAAIAATFALSPVAFFGVTSGMQAAHADLGWCDECDVVVGGGSPITSGPTAPTAPAPIVTPISFR